MALHKRKKLFVDSEVQGKLALRVVAYWLACMATLELLQLTWRIASGPEQPSFTAYFVNYNWRVVGGRVLIATILLVPILWDALKFSNRFAGPVFRMRRVLREVAQGRTVEPVRLRSGDYWRGMADDLNAALERLAAFEGDRQPSGDDEPSTAPCQDQPADAACQHATGPSR